MDMNEALSTWTEIGDNYTFAGWDAPEAYYTLFIKDGTVVGHIKATSNGIGWDYPQELLDYTHAKEEAQEQAISSAETMEHLEQ